MALQESKLSALPSWLPPLVTVISIGIALVGVIFVFAVIADALSQATEPVDANVTTYEDIQQENLDRVKERLNLQIDVPGTSDNEGEGERDSVDEVIGAGDNEGSGEDATPPTLDKQPEKPPADE